MSLPRHYKVADAQVRNFTGVVSELVQLDPYNGSSFNTSTRKIKYRLPRVGVLDGIKSYQKCDVNVAGGSSDSLASHFNKIKVWVGNQLIVDSTDDGRMRTLEMDAYTMTDEANSATLKATGYRQVVADDTTQTKRMSLSHPKYFKRGFFAKKLPLFKMNQVTIEFELYDDLNTFTSGDATAITVDNCKLMLHILDGAPIKNEYVGEIKGSFLAHEKHFRNLVNGASKINEQIPAHYNNLNFVIIEQQSNALVDLGVTSQNYNFSSNHTLNSINNIELQIDGERFPKTPIQTDDVAEIVDNLQKGWAPNSQYLGDVIHNYSDKSDESNMYVIIPLAQELKAVSGQKLSNKSGTVVVKADVTSAQQTDLTIWTVYNKFYKITAGSGTGKGEGAISVFE